MSNPALILLVRFESSLSLEEITQIAEKRAPQFRALAGLQQKYYLRDAATGEYAGLYLWQSPDDFAAFRDSELRASIAETYQVEGEPRIEVYGVMKVLRDETAWPSQCFPPAPIQVHQQTSDRSSRGRGHIAPTFFRKSLGFGNVSGLETVLAIRWVVHERRYPGRRNNGNLFKIRLRETTDVVYASAWAFGKTRLTPPGRERLIQDVISGFVDQASYTPQLWDSVRVRNNTRMRLDPRKRPVPSYHARTICIQTAGEILRSPKEEKPQGRIW